MQTQSLMCSVAAGLLFRIKATRALFFLGRRSLREFAAGDTELSSSARCKLSR